MAVGWRRWRAWWPVLGSSGTLALMMCVSILLDHGEGFFCNVLTGTIQDVHKVRLCLVTSYKLKHRINISVA